MTETSKDTQKTAEAKVTEVYLRYTSPDGKTQMYVFWPDDHFNFHSSSLRAKAEALTLVTASKIMGRNPSKDWSMDPISEEDRAASQWKPKAVRPAAKVEDKLPAFPAGYKLVQVSVKDFYVDQVAPRDTNIGLDLFHSRDEALAWAVADSLKDKTLGADAPLSEVDADAIVAHLEKTANAPAAVKGVEPSPKVERSLTDPPPGYSIAMAGSGYYVDRTKADGTLLMGAEDFATKAKALSVAWDHYLGLRKVLKVMESPEPQVGPAANEYTPYADYGMLFTGYAATPYVLESMPLVLRWGPFVVLRTEVYGGPYSKRPDTILEETPVYVKMAKEIAQPADISVACRDFDSPPEEEFKVALRRTVLAILLSQRVFVGCMGGTGRTGTMLAALAKTFGLSESFQLTNFKKEPIGVLVGPVGYVRNHYRARAVETKEQLKFVDDLDVSGLRRSLLRAAVLRWVFRGFRA